MLISVLFVMFFFALAGAEESNVPQSLPPSPPPPVTHHQPPEPGQLCGPPSPGAPRRRRLRIRLSSPWLCSATLQNMGKCFMKSLYNCKNYRYFLHSNINVHMWLYCMKYWTGNTMLIDITYYKWFFFNLQIQRNQYACYLWGRSQCQICYCKDTCLQETENKELKLYQLKNALTDNSMKLKNVYMNLCIPDYWGYSLTSEILIHCDINSVWFK